MSFLCTETLSIPKSLTRVILWADSASQAYLWHNHSFSGICSYQTLYGDMYFSLNLPCILISNCMPHFTGFFFPLIMIQIIFSLSFPTFQNNVLWDLIVIWVIIFSSVQSLSRVWLFENPRTAARQASLSITNSQSLLKLMSIESVILSNHLFLCHPLLLPSIFPASGSFPWVSSLHKVARVLELQLQHESF